MSENVNQIKINGKVYRVSEGPKMKVLRIMFRDAVNRTGFINVLADKNLEIKKDEYIYCEGNLCMSDADEKRKYCELYVYAEIAKKTEEPTVKVEKTKKKTNAKQSNKENAEQEIF